MIWFLILFIIVDIIQVLYIKHLKKEISLRDSENKENPVFTSKKKNRVIKLIKEVFWI